MNFKSNFSFLENDNPKLAEIIHWAEVYLQEDPNTCLFKIGQFGELLAQTIADKGQVKIIKNEEQYELLKRLKTGHLINEDINDLFHDIRKTRNDAAHNFNNDYNIALTNLKYAHQLAIWYYKKFVNPYFIHTTPFITPNGSSFTTAKETFSHYKNILKQLLDSLNNLDELKIKVRNFATDRQQIKRQEENLKLIIIDKKRQAENRQHQVLREQQTQRDSLRQQINRLDSELIRVEIEISDLKGFESNSEIMGLLRLQYQQKEALQKQKTQLNYSLNQVPENPKLSGYYPRETIEIQSLFNKLDNLTINQNNYEEEVKKELNKQQEEAQYLKLEIDFLHNFASKQNIELPVISYEILRAMDNHNLKFN